MDKAYIVLADGQVFEGQSFGAAGESVGELVFTTGMCGYIETLTDPSYAGQIIMQTFPLIGNYGMIEQDRESGKPAARGYVVREWCEHPSNFRSGGDIDRYLKDNGIVGVCGVDTRQLTRIIREHGVINAAIVKDPSHADPEQLSRYLVRGVVAEVSLAESETHPAEGEERRHVALFDYGAKRNITRELQKRGCRVTVVPQDTKAGEILSGNYDGIMLSNGPGDPEENTGCIAEISRMLGKIPIFGICLGHQLLALAAGGRTSKLKYGHRGVNQPVRDLLGGRTFITSQNHGYAVEPDSLPEGAVLRYVNANDATCEGVDYPDQMAFTVQFHPEGASGPRDTAFLFDRFCALMDGRHTTSGGEVYA